MALDLSRRGSDPELMDDPAVPEDELRACLDDLAAVNTVTLARRPTLDFLARAARRAPGRPLAILDVGYGHGDMLRAVHAWSRRRGVAVELSGVDLSPWSAVAARDATPPEAGIRYETGDVFAYRPERPVDLVVSSLFTHHLPDPEAARFLRWMEGTARLGWFVNDLHRHALAYHGFRLMARLARWHRFVQHDGPVSIARAFRPEDWARLVREAGLDPGDVRIRRVFPFRLCVERLR